MTLKSCLAKRNAYTNIGNSQKQPTVHQTVVYTEELYVNLFASQA
ncbi:hypothetical protein Tsp_11417, partial [Trichinella spiralis]